MYTVSPNFLLSAPSYYYSLHIWKHTIASPLLPLALQNCGHQREQGANDKRDGREKKSPVHCR